MLEGAIRADKGNILEHQPDSKRTALTLYQQQRMERAQQINGSIGQVINTNLRPEQRGQAWRQALSLGSTDPKRLREAGQVFDTSLQRFRERGERAFRDISVLELNELARVNFDLALSVKEGSVSREAALVIGKLYSKELNSEQLLELSKAFVARSAGEKLEDFELRRNQQKDEIDLLDGKTREETWTVKRKVEDVLEIYNMLEAGAINKSKWPIRSADGQIRRSFINRSAVLDVAIQVLKDIHSCADLESKRQEIERGSKIPKEIKNLKQLVDIVEERGDIKAVTFDMFDTLVQWTSNGKERHNLMSDSATVVFRKYGIPITHEEYDSIRNPIWYGVKSDRTAKGQEFQAVEVLTQIVGEVAKRKKGKLNPSQYREVAEKLEAAFIGVDADTAVPMPGAIDVLRALRDKGVKIAIISNHPYNNHSVKSLLRKYGLLKYADKVIVSSDVGYLKSSVDTKGTIFKAALKELGVPANSVIHVGDNNDADQKAPSILGIQGVVYNNPQANQKKVHGRNLAVGSQEYRDVSMNAYKEASRLNAKSYFDAHRNELTSPELEPNALRFYEISRDNYAPLMIKFAEHNLGKLKADPELLNLCVGRDGLASFLVQRKLIELFPEKYGSIDATRIQFTPVSRLLVDKADRKSLSEFLGKTGFNKSKRINIIDNGIAGSTQDSLTELFPEKDIQGNYLLSRKFSDDPNKAKKYGMVVETNSRRTPGTRGLNVRGIVDVISGGLADKDLKTLFMSSEFVHDQEDMWNGIFDSAQPLVNINGQYRPANAYNKMSYIPGNPDAIPALNVDGYLLLKKMGLKGIIDGVHMYRRQAQLGMDYSPEHAIRLLGNWFRKANNDKKGGIDNDLIRAMVRLKV